LLNALGIRMVGERAAQLLASRFGGMDALCRASLEEVAEIHGIGPKIAQAVTRFFSEQANLRTIERLRAAGVTMGEEGSSRGPRPLARKTFVITGSLSSMSRDEAKNRIAALGGRVTSAVSKKTDYVVVGTDPGTKAEDARRLGVTMLDDAAFLKLVGSE
jgi:DNA ligase (NAD+)